MGYTSGQLSGRGSGEKYTSDSFRIGRCGTGDKLESCSAGHNEYQRGGAFNIYNTPAKCDKNQKVKITITCTGGGSINTRSSCPGKVIRNSNYN